DGGGAAPLGRSRAPGRLVAVSGTPRHPRPPVQQWLQQDAGRCVIDGGEAPLGRSRPPGRLVAVSGTRSPAQTRLKVGALRRLNLSDRGAYKLRIWPRGQGKREARWGNGPRKAQPQRPPCSTADGVKLEKSAEPQTATAPKSDAGPKPRRRLGG